MSAISLSLDSVVDVRLKRFAVPAMRLQLGFAEVSDGSLAPVPRARGDAYEASAVAFGTRDEIQAIGEYLDAHRDPIALTSVATPVFAPLINHATTLTAYIRPEIPSQQAFVNGEQAGYYELPLFLRASEYSLTPIDGSLSALRRPPKFSTGHDDASLPRWSYDGVPDVADTEDGAGLYRGTFYQTIDEAAAILEFWRSTRGQSFVFPELPGVPYPFGMSRGSYPDARATLNVDSIQRANIHFYLLTLSFRQAFR